MDNLLGVATAVETVIIGVIATYIAYQQHITAKRKLTFDLFERRFKIFETVGIVFGDAVGAGGQFKAENLNNLLLARSSAQFLMGPDIVEYIGEVYSHANDLQYALNEWSASKDGPGGTERTKFRDMKNEHFKWFADNLKIFPDKFIPYLKI